MQKEFLLKSATNSILVSKKKIKYKIIDFNNFNETIQNKIIKSMIKFNRSKGIYDDNIIPPKSIIMNINNKLNEKPLFINTFFIENGTIEYEEKNIEIKPGNILIKGPISEIYKVKSEESLLNRYEKIKNCYVPKSYPVHVVKINKKLYKILFKSGLFGNNKDYLTINTSYGGTHTVKINDYILIEDPSFYRIQKIAFQKTYRKID